MPKNTRSCSATAHVRRLIDFWVTLRTLFCCHLPPSTTTTAAASPASPKPPSALEKCKTKTVACNMRLINAAADAMKKSFFFPSTGGWRKTRVWAAVTFPERECVRADILLKRDGGGRKTLCLHRWIVFIMSSFFYFSLILPHPHWCTLGEKWGIQRKWYVNNVIMQMRAARFDGSRPPMVMREGTEWWGDGGRDGDGIKRRAGVCVCVCAHVRASR